VLNLAAVGVPVPATLNFPSAPPLGTGIYEPGTAGIYYDTTNTPYAMQYNLTIQRELAAGMVLSVGYNGATGVHLFSEREANFPLAASNQFNTIGQPNPNYNPAATGSPGSLTNPFVGEVSNPNLGSMTMDAAASHSTYNSLQAQLNRQFSSRLSGQVAYTWSKCRSDGDVSSGFEQGENE